MLVSLEFALIFEPLVVLLYQINLLLEALLAEFGAGGGRMGGLRSLFERRDLLPELAVLILLRIKILRKLIICLGL